MDVMYETEDCYYKVPVFACSMVAFLVNITTDTQNSQQYIATSNIQINKLKHTHN